MSLLSAWSISLDSIFKGAKYEGGPYVSWIFPLYIPFLDDAAACIYIQYIDEPGDFR